VNVLRRGPAAGAHAEADALTVDVLSGHVDLHHVTGLHHLVRILHEPVGESADMDKAVLVHADIHEGPKGRHVGDRALEPHPLAQDDDVAHALGKGRRLQTWARIAAGLLDLPEDVVDGGQAELVGHEGLRFHAPARLRVRVDRTQIPAAGDHDLPGLSEGLQPPFSDAHDQDQSATTLSGSAPHPEGFSMRAAARRGRPGGGGPR